MKSESNFSYLIFLSVVAVLGVFLFEYDTAVISGTIDRVSQLSLGHIPTRMECWLCFGGFIMGYSLLES